VHRIGQPLRVIVDSQLRTPLQAAVLDEGHALIATAIQDENRLEPYRQLGVEVISLPNDQQQVDLPRLMLELGARGLNEVLTEAGASLNGALIAAGCADALLLYIAPCLLGMDARGMFSLPQLTDLHQRQQLLIQQITPIGEDLRVQARFSNG
jgi:diaminohydroxyphosphoribosylaminopyrimidine deaminase/5-amino-6-(5-phosphoribosylamino)uracil reductase